MVFFPDGALPLKEAYERFQTCFPSRSKGADGEDADKEVQDKFIAALLRGAFIVKVFDPKRNRIFSLTRRQLTDYFFLDLLIARGAIGDFTDGPLADYVGLTPYVERSDFEEWLGTLMSEESRADDLQDSQPQPSRAPVLSKKECIRWYSDRAHSWPQTKGPPSATQDWEDAKRELSATITRDRVRLLRRDHAPKEWTARGRRSRTSAG